MLTDEQIRVYLDEPLDPAQRAALEEQIALDPAAQRKILDHRRMEQALTVLLAPPENGDRLKQSVLAVLEGPPPEALRNLVLRDTQIDPDLVTRANRAVIWSALALAACVAMAALLLNRLNLASAPENVAQLEQVQGAVTVAHQVGAPLLAGNQFGLQPGDTVAVPAAGSATILYPDGTSLQLAAGTRVKLNTVPGVGPAGNTVDLQSGDMTVNVGANSGGHPLQVSTPQATISATQGELQLSASTNSTQLNVNSGAAQIAQPSTRQTTLVTAGQFILATPGGSFLPQPMPHRPNLQPQQTPNNFQPNQRNTSPATNQFHPQTAPSNTSPMINHPPQNGQTPPPRAPSTYQPQRTHSGPPAGHPFRRPRPSSQPLSTSGSSAAYIHP